MSNDDSATIGMPAQAEAALGRQLRVLAEAPGFVGNRHENDWESIEAWAIGEAEKAKRAVLEHAGDLHAFELLANYVAYVCPLDAETYKESTHGRSLAHVEYLAALLTERASVGRSPSFGESGGHAIQDIDRSIQRVFDLRAISQMASIRDDQELGSIRHLQAVRELQLRNESYDWQEVATLRALYADERIERDLFDVVGLGIDDAITLADILDRWIPETILEAADGAHQTFDAVMQDGEYPSDGWTLPDHVIETLRSATDDPLDVRRGAFMMMHMWHKLGDRCALDAHALSKRSGIPVDPCRAMLDLLAMHWRTELPNEPVRAIQHVRERPILRIDDRYLPLGNGNVLFALRPALEAALMASEKTRHRFERHRADIAESQAINLVAGVLEPDFVARQVNWNEGETRHEMDGLLIIDDVAVVIEAKSGRMPVSARRAAPKSLRTALQRLAFEAHDQAHTAELAIRNGQHLHDVHGTPLRLPTQRIKKVLRVAITLESVGFGPTVWSLSRQGPWRKHRVPPSTTMSLHDLELVCDLLDSPSMLLHYFVRRQWLDYHGGIVGMEEADLVMYYLDQGLFPDGEDGTLILPSLTDDLDAYHAYRRGQRQTPASRPSRQRHSEIQAVLQHLETSRPDGWTSAAALILDLSGETQDDLGQRIQSMKEQSEGDGRTHDISFGLDLGSLGMTVLTVPPSQVAESRKLLDALVKRNKYRFQADLWVGLAFQTGSSAASGPLLAVNAGAWQRETAMEQELATSPAPSATRSIRPEA